MVSQSRIECRTFSSITQGAKLTIFGVIGKGGNGNQSPNEIIIFCIIFSAVALTWMISAYICNLVLSQEYHQEEEEKRQYSKGNKSWEELFSEIFFRSSFFLIWLSEAFIGIATIPTLIGTARLSAMSSASANATWKDYVEPYEYFEIAIGIGLFALINILSAIAKAKRYRFITQDKVHLGRAIAERDYTKNRISELRNEVSAIETKIAELERKIENPEFDLENVFNRSISDLSTLYMQGRDIDGIKPPIPNLSNEEELDKNTTNIDDFKFQDDDIDSENK
jgi:hypothetical protein